MPYGGLRFNNLLLSILHRTLLNAIYHKGLTATVQTIRSENKRTDEVLQYFIKYFINNIA